MDNQKNKREWRKQNLGLMAVRWGFRSLGGIAPKLAGRLAYRMWFSPRRLKRPERERAFLASADEAFKLSVRGKKIAAWSWGEGPAVLLVHGWEGRGAQFEILANTLLKKGFRIITFDQPAHGDSEGRQTDVEEIRLVMMELEALVGSFHAAVTHSFGAVALAYAISLGLETNRVVMINPPARFKTMLRIFQSELGIPDKALQNMLRRIENRLPHLGENVYNAIDTANNAAGFGFPGLVIHDANDRVVPLAQGQMIADAWNQSELRITNDLGHYRILKQPKVAEEISEYLSTSVLMTAVA